MKRILLLCVIGGFFLVSCESEYEERLEEGRHLKNRLVLLEHKARIYEGTNFEAEKEEIEKQILLLSKVSGNEELFLSEVFNGKPPVIHTD